MSPVPDSPSPATAEGSLQVPAAETSSQTLRRQPSASRITVSTKKSQLASTDPHQPQETVDHKLSSPHPDGQVVVKETSPVGDAPSLKANAHPTRPSKRRAARRGRRALAIESEGEESDQDSDVSSDSSQTGSTIDFSDSPSEDDDDEDDDDDDEEEEDQDEEGEEEEEEEEEGASESEKEGGEGGRVDAQSAKDGSSLAIVAEARVRQEWSEMADEELMTAPLAQVLSEVAASKPLSKRQRAKAKAKARAAENGGAKPSPDSEEKVALAQNASLDDSVNSLRDGSVRGRGGRGGRGARGGPHPTARAAIAYREKLENDPSFTPRVGQFWGHDERLVDRDLRSLSGWWRGRGGAARGSVARAGPFPSDRPAHRGGRGGLRGTQIMQRGGGGWEGGRGRGGIMPSIGRGGMAATQPPARKSKLAGWSDDESEVDDDAITGRAVKKVPSGARPIVPFYIQQQQLKQQQRGEQREQMEGVPTAPRALLAAEKEAADVKEAKAEALRQRQEPPHQDRDHSGRQGGEEGMDAGSSGPEVRKQEDQPRADWEGLDKVGEWQASLSANQVSPHLPAPDPDSAASISLSSDNNHNQSNGAGSGKVSDAVAKVPSSSPLSTSSPTPALSLQENGPSTQASTVKLGGGGFGRSEGPGDGRWAHDGYENLRRAEEAGAARGRGATPRGFVRGARGGLRGRGRGTAWPARGRGGLANAQAGKPRQPVVVGAPPEADGKVEAKEDMAMTQVSSSETVPDVGIPVKVNLPKATKKSDVEVVSEVSVEGKTDRVEGNAADEVNVTSEDHATQVARIPGAQLMSASASASAASSSSQLAPAIDHTPSQPVFVPPPPHMLAYPQIPMAPGTPTPPPPPVGPSMVYPPPPQSLPPGFAIDGSGTVYDLSGTQPLAVAFYPPAAPPTMGLPPQGLGRHQGYMPPPHMQPHHQSLLAQQQGRALNGSSGARSKGPAASAAVVAAREKSGDAGRKTHSRLSSTIPSSAVKAPAFRPGGAANIKVDLHPTAAPLANHPMVNAPQQPEQHVHPHHHHHPQPHHNQHLGEYGMENPYAYANVYESGGAIYYNTPTPPGYGYAAGYEHHMAHQQVQHHAHYASLPGTPSDEALHTPLAEPSTTSASRDGPNSAFGPAVLASQPGYPHHAYGAPTVYDHTMAFYPSSGSAEEAELFTSQHLQGVDYV
ncbi:hypothetical protein IE53DRAFT_76748 [Violaceomyces palustris]|uniref:Uncharacterized protein n=1 Tax=Violaceomyces palustris TaxID=1673888 RepID=A0ACD0NY82_9BASI|nr:hypothetical protein IE53DRAFT_76748 [Violaceomyces palustris]